MFKTFSHNFYKFFQVWNSLHRKWEEMFSGDPIHLFSFVKSLMLKLTLCCNFYISAVFSENDVWKCTHIYVIFIKLSFLHFTSFIQKFLIKLSFLHFASFIQYFSNNQFPFNFDFTIKSFLCFSIINYLISIVWLAGWI